MPLKSESRKSTITNEEQESSQKEQSSTFEKEDNGERASFSKQDSQADKVESTEVVNTPVKNKSIVKVDMTVHKRKLFFCNT